MPKWHFSKPSIPPRAAVIATAALAVPFVDLTFYSQYQNPARSLLWLLALVPAFLLAYYRGWRGAATALAAGMAVLSVSIATVSLGGAEIRAEVLLPVVVPFITIALAAGWLSEGLHANRATAELIALTDDLTGLPNRRRARMFLDTQLAAPRGTPLSVVLFDLDNFKSYNDRYGHPAGDVMLCTFAQVLSSVAGKHDMPARYGGEEFLAVLSASNEQEATRFAERVRAELRLAQNGNQTCITVSAGIAQLSGAFSTANELIVAADRALYYAKQQGRDRICLAAESLAASG